MSDPTAGKEHAMLLALGYLLLFETVLCELTTSPERIMASKCHECVERMVDKEERQFRNGWLVH